jgi:hypothetical protein
MVFSSIEFLFLFLPAFLLALAIIPCKNLIYSIFSLFFYFIGEGWFAVITHPHFQRIEKWRGS